MDKFVKIFYCLLVFVFLFFSCNNSLLNQENLLKIAVDDGAYSSIKTISEAFKKQYPEVQIDFTVAASGNLSSQLVHSSSFDIFFASDSLFPKKLYNEGYIRVQPPAFYATSYLLMLLPNKIDEQNWDKYLLSPKVKKIAVPNPFTSAYGKITKKCLEDKNIWEKVKNKIIFTDGVMQSNRYFENKAVDVAFTTQSYLYENNNFHKYFILLNNYQSPQTMLLCNEKKNTKRFYEFLLTPLAQKILQQYGFKPID
jgi:molybdate transport system substrate-binding protein